MRQHDSQIEIITASKLKLQEEVVELRTKNTALLDREQEISRDHKKAMVELEDKLEDLLKQNKKLKATNDQLLEQSPQPVNRGILMKLKSERSDVTKGNQSPPRRVSIKVDESYGKEGIAASVISETQELLAEQQEESAGGTGSSTSDQQDNKASTGSD